MRIFERNPGGAVANVAAAVSKLGACAAFIGKVGSDMHGDFLRDTMEETGVDTEGLIRTEEAFTTLAFVALRPDGERTFSFARKPGADLLLRPEEIDRGILDRTKILHTGSLSLAEEPCRSAVLQALDYAKKHEKIISYDPNYRASLWDCEKTATKYMAAACKICGSDQNLRRRNSFDYGERRSGESRAHFTGSGRSLRGGNARRGGRARFCGRGMQVCRAVPGRKSSRYYRRRRLLLGCVSVSFYL